jgi:hypothetical protein
MGSVVGSVTAQPAGPAWTDLLRHDVIPVVSGYALLVVMLLRYGVRRRSSGTRGKLADTSGAADAGGTGPGLADLVRYLARTALGGYVVFLLIVTLYYFALGGEAPSFLKQALWGGAFLGFAVAIPAFLVIDRLHRSTDRGDPGRSGESRRKRVQSSIPPVDR